MTTRATVPGLGRPMVGDSSSTLTVVGPTYGTHPGSRVLLWPPDMCCLLAFFLLHS